MAPRPLRITDRRPPTVYPLPLTTLTTYRSEAPHPVTLSDPEWSLFLVYWRKVKIWDFVEAAMAEKVKMVRLLEAQALTLTPARNLAH